MQIVDAAYYNEAGGRSGSIGQDSKEAEFSILETVGLVRRVQTRFAVGDRSFILAYYYLTFLGFEFARACKIVAY
jgi:hypothetical protein